MQALRIPALCKVLGVSRATVWRMAKADPSFPRPVRLSPGVVAWLSTDIENWLRSRPKAEGIDDAQVEG